MSKRVSIVLPNETSPEREDDDGPELRRSSSRQDLESHIVIPEYQTIGIVGKDNAIQNSNSQQSTTDDGESSTSRIAQQSRENESNDQSVISKSSLKSSLKFTPSQISAKYHNMQLRNFTHTFTLVSTDEPNTMPSATDDDKEPPSTSCDCPLYSKDCNCCHCSHMKLATKQAAFLRSPEGQRRQEIKLLAKNFFMDICAMSQVRKEILNKLHGTQQDHPSSRVSYPVSLKNARILDSNSLVIEWHIHDHSDIDYYKIFVDSKLAKRVYNVKSTDTILIDLDTHKMHNLRMKAIPHKGRGSKADPMDKLAVELCAGRINNVMKGDFFCNCDNGTKATKAFYKKNKCKSLIDFWKDSEFLYMPNCRCAGTSECECFMDQCEDMQQHHHQQQPRHSGCL